MSKNNSKLMQFARGTVILTLSNLFIKAANFFLLPLYTAYLTPDQLGLSDSIVSLIAIIFPILVVAFDSSFSAFYFEKENEDYKKSVFNTTFFFLLGMSMLTIIPILFSKQLSLLMFGTAEYNLSIQVAMLAVAVNMWFLPFSLLVRIQNRMTLFSVISLVTSLSMMAMNIYFVTVLKWGYFSLIVSNLFVNIIQLALFAAFGKMKLNIKLFDKNLFLKMIKFSLPILPVVVAGWALSLSDRYIILYYLGEYEVGIYGIAARFLNVLTVITSAIYTAFTSFAFSSNKDDNAKDQYIFVLDILHVVLLFICLAASVFSTEILHLMVEKSYYSADILIGPLLLGQVCYAANTIMGYGFAYEKKSSYFLIPTFAGAIINIILNFVFIPKFGAYAASITTFVGYLVMMIITYYLSQRVYKCEYHFSKLMISVIVSFTVILLIPYLSFGLKIGVFVILILTLFMLYKDTILLLVRKLKSNIKQA